MLMAIVAEHYFDIAQHKQNKEYARGILCALYLTKSLSRDEYAFWILGVGGK